MPSERELVNIDEFSNTLTAIKQKLIQAQINIFINVRTDTFLLGHTNVLEETKKRIHRYQAAGADGIFIPCITKESDISAVVKYIQLPVNVMCMPDLPNFEVLEKLKVKRISMGNFSV